MSQFMICKSKANLEKYGGSLLGIRNINYDLCREVLKEYYPDAEDGVWIIENIHTLCNDVLDYEEFIISELYHILDNIYDLSEWMILWYGCEYGCLEELYTKEELINYVKCCVEKPCCEMYAIVSEK